MRPGGGFAAGVMPKPRYLAPWHRPELLAARAALAARAEDAADDGLTAAELEALRGRPALYHCISRVVDRRFVLGAAEREQFVAYMRLYERFCQVQVLSFCVMSNHFHLLLEVPAAPAGRGRDWSDERLLGHLACLYPEHKLREVRWWLRHFRQQGDAAGAEALRESYLRRMWDLSQFMKTLKQRFARWHNREHGRKGTLWEERFRSVLVEDGHAARTIAAYIDLNPVRAGIVEDAKDYRWCSYGEAVAGKARAREGLQRVLFGSERGDRSGTRAADTPSNWRQAAHRYRQLLDAGLGRGKPRASVARGDRGAGVRQLSEAEALRCRVRYFIDGMAIGSQRFIERVFGLTRARFGPKRRTGARRLRRIDTTLRSLRDLRVDAVAAPG